MICFSLCHDQSMCSRREGRVESYENNSDEPKPGLNVVSYKAAITQGLGESLAQQQTESFNRYYQGQDKGKGKVHEPRDTTVLNHIDKEHRYGPWKGDRRYREGGSKSTLSSGYLPLKEMTKRYEMSTSRLNELRTSYVEKFLSVQERKMLEAFHSSTSVQNPVRNENVDLESNGEATKVAGKTVRRGLLFENDENGSTTVDNTKVEVEDLGEHGAHDAGLLESLWDDMEIVEGASEGAELILADDDGLRLESDDVVDHTLDEPKSGMETRNQ